jgi:hypothetical protein
MDHSEIACEGELQANLGADRAAQDRFQLPDGRGRIDHFRIERLAAREAEELAGQRDYAVMCDRARLVSGQRQ